MHPLDGVHAKLARADEHLESLKADWETFVESEPYTFSYENTGNEIVARIRVREDVPFKLSLIVGDALNNLRSCLDHLAWQLGKFTGIKPPYSTEFPIFLNEGEFTRTGRGGGLYKIRALRPEHRAIIQSLQPYNSGDDAIVQPLWVLHRLANLDKHRIPSYALPIIEEGQLVALARGVRVSSSEVIPGPFVDSAVVGRLFYIRTDARTNAQMRVDFRVTFNVTFEEAGLFEERVIPDLHQLRDAVAAVPPLFEDAFK